MKTAANLERLPVKKNLLLGALISPHVRKSLEYG